MLVLVRRYLLAGLLFWIPIGVTVFLLMFLIGLLDAIVAIIPARYNPAELLGLHIPGMGLLICLLIIFVSGILVTNLLGRQLVRLWDAMIGRIPLVRSVYSGIQQVLHTLVSSGSDSFRQVYLLEYPRKGVWTIVFQTSTSCRQVCDIVGEELVTVYVPTTPNPTSGFVLMVSRQELRAVSMSVDQALKLVISLGVAQPPTRERTKNATVK